jgi:hypothetical protein
VVHWTVAALAIVTLDRSSAGIAATHFFTGEVWTKNGLVTYFVLFVIDPASRSVEIAGISSSPDSAWMCQTACNLVDDEDGFLRGKRCLLMDRDGGHLPNTAPRSATPA